MLTAKDLSLSFEDDLMLHNRLLESITTATNAGRQPLQNYEIQESTNALKAIAQLVKAKAERQKLIIETAVQNCSSSVEILK